MNLADLGLKTKPATKYFDGGYISFSTTNHELSYNVTRVTKTNQATIDGGTVRDQGHLKLLLGVKTISEVLGLE